MGMYWIFVLGLCVACVAPQSVRVNTQYGPVAGRKVEVNNGRTVTTVDEFRGIPFAKETSGARRFASPEAPDRWTEALDVTTPRDACPQSRALVWGTNAGFDKFSEDCLHLDIYTPDATGGDSFPVMVWLYGGAYQVGANVQYPGHFLATHGVVVVVVNYRLGKFGYAYTGNEACPGNAALWDQKMGLDFVLNNIDNFGGNPNQITVFGESAGAGSTALFMLSPETKDLFQQAILESGAETNFWVANLPESNPENYIHQVAADLECDGLDDFAMIDCLRELSMDAILYNSSVSCTPGYFCLGMAPVVDGEGGFLPKTPRELRDDGDVMNGPILSGIMQDDGALFVPILVPETIFGCCNRSYFQYILRERILSIWGVGFDNVTMEDVFQSIDWAYSQWPYVYERERNRDALVRLITDGGFGAPWDEQLKNHHTVADTYGFIFDYRSKNSSLPDWMGVSHGGEIPYVWGYPMLDLNEHIRNDSMLSVGGFNDEDIQYSLYFQELLTNFAKYGNPTEVDVEKPMGGATDWPTYDMDNLGVLYINDQTIEVKNEYRQKKYAYWHEYIHFLVYGISTDPEAAFSFGNHYDVPSEVVTAMLEANMFNYDEELVEDIAMLLEAFYNF